MITSIYQSIKACTRKILFMCIALALSFSLNACMKKPVFIKIESVKIGSLKDSTLETVINFKIYNPNRIGSSITASKINTFYKGKLVGSSTIDKPIDLPARDTVIIPLHSKINLWSLAAVFPELLKSDSAAFNITGDNKIKVLSVSWTIPVKEQVKLNIKNAVIEQVSETFKSDSNFKIKELKLVRIPGLSKTNFKMVVQVKNGFPFDYKLLQLDLDIYRKNGTNPIAKWKLTDAIAQKSGAQADIPISIEVDNLALLSEARLSDILHPNTEIVIKGQAKVSVQGKEFTIPVEETRKVSFNPLTGVSI